jgi:predicted O-methyltransferase YrrM
MEFDEIRRKVDGIPHMTAHRGRVIYDHIRTTRPSLTLELGSACGVSAAYMAGALEANDHGRLVSIDVDWATYQPRPETLLGELGLGHRAECIRVADSSYNWMLRGQVADRCDAAGNCEPLYDFVFIDGAHEFTIDGLAAVLSIKLLRPGGWLLLDDLDWSHAQHDNPGPFPMSQAQLTTPNVREVYDLLIRTDPDLTEFREEDGSWGWAKKGNGLRTLTLSVSEGPFSIAMRKAKALVK